jgi:hypothetical protein
MNADIYAEWLRRQGRCVVRTDSSYWHSDGFRVYQAFPYHWLIQPAERELRELMSRQRVTALRYSMPVPGGEPTDGYHVTYTAADYDFETLSVGTRNNVRRGLSSCTVDLISNERYTDEGWALRVDTLARQGRRMKESRDDWRRKCCAIADLPGFEVWAALVGDRLAATMLVFQLEAWAYVVYHQSHRDFLRAHVNNALTFRVTQDLIRRPHIHGIFYGMRSLDAPPSVDEFKFHMGYEAKPVRQRIVFHPCLSPMVNRLTCHVARMAASASPKSRWLTKAAGMFRICLAEKRSPLPNSLAYKQPSQNSRN